MTLMQKVTHLTLSHIYANVTDRVITAFVQGRGKRCVFFIQWPHVTHSLFT